MAVGADFGLKGWTSTPTANDGFGFFQPFSALGVDGGMANDHFPASTIRIKLAVILSQSNHP